MALLLLLSSLLVACGGETTPAASPLTPPRPSFAATATVPPATSDVGTVEAEGTADNYAAEREALVEQGVVGLGITEPAVVDAMRAVPRHRFVPKQYRTQAYENHPLPIGYGQTISQPYIVALMTEAAAVGAGDTVLEVGTGSGYQAAVLAEIVDHVYTLEIIGALAERAEDTLDTLGYENVTVRRADGYFGWEAHAPYDAIVVTAAPDHVPQPLVEQLKVGGQMIIPVGPVGGYQTLWRITKVSEEEVQTEDLGGVRFVPLTREEEE
jgi:protein-L-isoaspartate(D-aspartate) O-methyltransferase